MRAKQFNAWLQTQFMCLEGAHRAYIEFPFEVTLGDDRSTCTATHMKRLVFLVISAQGSEEDCCRVFKDLFLVTCTPRELEDQDALLFIRAPFEYNEGFGRIRFAFWSDTKNLIMRKSAWFLEPGYLARRIEQQEV